MVLFKSTPIESFKRKTKSHDLSMRALFTTSRTADRGKVMKCKLMMMLFIACCEAMFRYLLLSTVGPEGKKKNAIEQGIINIFGLSRIISDQKCILTSEHEVRRYSISSIFDAR